ncbi:hypothetical protein AOQ84DRAFT_227904 [Glonium stellatum]|uniref:Uncharacterized protein n=1 Tax=Glonium stellatum TaxID=574774 RepID=A0A8E2F820_9PEZI|nr:hypothetical protein AOQ84DRAFT_227904 [Glonium stellatum]
MQDKWSPCLQTLEGHHGDVSSIALSHDSTRLASASRIIVKIWDASSGACLRTLEVGRPFYRTSFCFSGSYLHTEIGTIDISAQSGSNKYQGLALSSDGVWIAYNSEKLVWLPSEYRPSCLAVSEKMIGIGVETGRVWICEVQLDAS